MEIGSLVKSIKGHDCGKIYVVVDVKDDFLMVCDGVYKTLSNPKKKRQKHVQNLFEVVKDIEDKLKTGDLYDYEIKRAIKLQSKLHKD